MVRTLLRLLGITYFVSPSGNLVVQVKQDELGTKVYVKKLYTSKIGRIFAEILS